MSASSAGLVPYYTLQCTVAVVSAQQAATGAPVQYTPLSGVWCICMHCHPTIQLSVSCSCNVTRIAEKSSSIPLDEGCRDNETCNPCSVERAPGGVRASTSYSRTAVRSTAVLARAVAFSFRRTPDRSPASLVARAVAREASCRAAASPTALPSTRARPC